MRMGYRQHPQPTHKAKQTMKAAAARNRLRRQRLARAEAQKHGTPPQQFDREQRERELG